MVADPIEVAAQALDCYVPFPQGLVPRMVLREMANDVIAAWLEAAGLYTVPFAGRRTVQFRDLRKLAEAVRAVEQSS